MYTVCQDGIDEASMTDQVIQLLLTQSQCLDQGTERHEKAMMIDCSFHVLDRLGSVDR